MNGGRIDRWGQGEWEERERGHGSWRDGVVMINNYDDYKALPVM